MSLLSVHDLAFECAGERLFSAASFQIHADDRIGLIGSNGCGKTTLLRILAREIEPTAGSLVGRRGLRVVYVPQPEPLGRDLSAGQAAQEDLAAAMRAQADLLLLDEPTNHLDIRARQWLEETLARLHAAALLVSHDRVLLNRATSRTLEIERGKVQVYEGNYDFYRDARALADRRQSELYQGQQRRIAAAARAAERRIRLAGRVAKAPAGVRSGSDFYGRKAAKVARTARILSERRTHEPEIAKPWEETPIPALDFSGVIPSGQVVVRVQALEKRSLYSGLGFTVRRGERWAIDGPNGCGKTTLLRMLVGEVAPDSGQIDFGSKVRVGYYAQQAENLDPRRSALEIVGGDQTLARTLLGCLKLRPDQAHQPAATLSAGERGKVALARLLAGGANLLLLDEPTNHLEIRALEALEAALAQYPGTILFASHDRRFVELLAGHVLDLSAPVLSGSPA